MEYSIKFSDNCSAYLREKIIECLTSSGLDCELSYEEGNTILYVGAKFDTLLNKAIETGMKKLKKGEKIMMMQEMSRGNIDEFEGIHDADSFFTPAEKSLLVYSCITGVSLNTIQVSWPRFKIQISGIEESLVTALRHSKPQIIESVDALHNQERKMILWKKMKSNMFECPVDDIRDYFGGMLREHEKSVSRLVQTIQKHLVESYPEERPVPSLK